MNVVKEQIFLTEVQLNLVELEGVIAYQMNQNWDEPHLVTAELGDVLNGLLLSNTTASQLSMLSREDKEIIDYLYTHLSRFPNDEVYKFAQVTEEDQKNFEDLQKMLREVGLGLNLSVSVNYNNFINKAELLNEKLNLSFKYSENSLLYPTKKAAD